MKSLRITPIDDDAVINGNWTYYRGVRLKIARANNPKFKTLFMKLSKPYHKQLSGNTVTSADEETLKEMLCQCMAKAILVGWEDFVVGGEEIPYSEENAFSLLYQDDDCREFVTKFSQDLENFIKEENEETVVKS